MVLPTFPLRFSAAYSSKRVKLWKGEAKDAEVHPPGTGRDIVEDLTELTSQAAFCWRSVFLLASEAQVSLLINTIS